MPQISRRFVIMQNKQDKKSPGSGKHEGQGGMKNPGQSQDPKHAQKDNDKMGGQQGSKQQDPQWNKPSY